MPAAVVASAPKVPHRERAQRSWTDAPPVKDVNYPLLMRLVGKGSALSFTKEVPLVKDTCYPLLRRLG